MSEFPGRIKFNDQAMTLHEYPSELHMLEEYLLKHPEEEELVIVESYRNDIEDDDTPPGTPRNNNDDEGLRSNTALSHSGGLSSYVSKYQSDFDWNDHREPDPIVIRPEPEQEITKSEELIPAGEDDTNTWSESTTSDLLF
ncbi:hypothetical protein LOTGIDRAFT_174763 [Lottia gigantea]|uniref:Uncharacterized protein n=1 Tax=Lottia gigantea TaxID=225164 RepID=V4APE3_LOTGI|nr:hypothetical protein LOTGIDRAFT_174763 [Lottia gigantea]ESO96660.1 hypothetical protein LOTGIDRAFT_174763 [Lottia gigantea]